MECYKQSFKSRKHAERALKAQRYRNRSKYNSSKKMKRHKQPTRVYLCPHCDKYHLTSKC